jgi:hypothetical protein
VKALREAPLISSLCEAIVDIEAISILETNSRLYPVKQVRETGPGSCAMLL